EDVKNVSSNVAAMEKMVSARARLQTFRLVSCIGMGIGSIPIVPLCFLMYKYKPQYLWFLLVPMVVFYKAGLLSMVLTSTQRKRMFSGSSRSSVTQTYTSKLSTTPHSPTHPNSDMRKSPITV
ncbi:MAG: hypothetical protein ACTSUE_07565, partial [Promethearchaeota archaeon]